MSVNMMAASLRCSALSESINGLNQTLLGMKQRILGPPNSRSQAKQLWRLSDAQQNPPTLMFRPQLNHVRVRTKRSCSQAPTASPASDHPISVERNHRHSII